MYDPLQQGWTRERIASIAVSILLNLGFITTFAYFASASGADISPRSALAVYELAGGSEPDEGTESEAKVDPPEEVSPAKEPVAQAEPIRRVAAVETEPVRTIDRTVSTPAPDIPQPHPSPQPPLLALKGLDKSPAPPPEPKGAQVAKAPVDRPASKVGGGDSDGYAATVKRHLLRFRRQNTVGPGSAFIRFTVLASGRCDNVGVAKSSGSSRFDREAMQMVRRAVPFPKPPDEASRDFNFEITGR